MLHADVLASLGAALERDPAPPLGDGDRMAAVLAPLVLEPEPALIFTMRAAALSRHAGEISFPGGLQDPGESLVETALREAHEEIGLEPSAVSVLGALPAVHTFVSAILVVPFVGTLARVPRFAVNEGEIDEVLVFGLDELAANERPISYDRPDGGVWRGFAYEVGGHSVWGATGSMLHTLLETMRKETRWPMT
ncbi:MAG TPA: CoA pyrophosphatase [Actinomycetota bacterium]|nr:CoA pyrophosphatase [Actinomycetota bacterium]